MINKKLDKDDTHSHTNGNMLVTKIIANIQMDSEATIHNACTANSLHLKDTTTLTTDNIFTNDHLEPFATDDTCAAATLIYTANVGNTDPNNTANTLAAINQFGKDKCAAAALTTNGNVGNNIQASPQMRLLP